MESIRITWYLDRYHGNIISGSSVYRTLARYGINQLHKGASRRAVHTKRYSKEVLGHQVQLDVKVDSLPAMGTKYGSSLPIHSQ